MSASNRTILRTRPTRAGVADWVGAEPFDWVLTVRAQPVTTLRTKTCRPLYQFAAVRASDPNRARESRKCLRKGISGWRRSLLSLEVVSGRKRDREAPEHDAEEHIRQDSEKRIPGGTSRDLERPQKACDQPSDEADRAPYRSVPDRTHGSTGFPLFDIVLPKKETPQLGRETLSSIKGLLFAHATVGVLLAL